MIDKKDKLSVGDNVVFAIPYFESFLYHYGEVLVLKRGGLVVKYYTNVDTQMGNKRHINVTEIPITYLRQIKTC